MANKKFAWLKRYRVSRGKSFRLKQVETSEAERLGFSKDESERLLADSLEQLTRLQEKLYAQNQWSLLLIFQGMDAAGKDSMIKHVMSGVNPQGVQVFSFKKPSDEELDHDYLWRAARCLPERGRIGIFNRSYYEEVLVVRVHPEILETQRLPDEALTKDIWNERFEDINAFERYLGRNGVMIRKFFLHMSKEEQRQRLLKRLKDPVKNWKFAVGDLEEREHWKTYMSACEEMIRSTATPESPWYVVPADQKWFARMVVSRVIIEALGEMHLKVPVMDAKRQVELTRVRRLLEKSR